MFFAFIGFDMVATAAEEAKSPLRDIPIASVGSVVITGSLYTLMATAITGMVYYTDVSGPGKRGGYLCILVITQT